MCTLYLANLSQKYNGFCVSIVRKIGPFEERLNCAVESKVKSPEKLDIWDGKQDTCVCFDTAVDNSYLT